MRWEPPFVVHGSHRISNAELRHVAASYRQRLETLAARIDAESDGIHV
jgi:putative NADPH-quinone reductase